MPPNLADRSEALDSLRRLAAAIDAGEVDASRSARAHIEGAIEALAWVTGDRSAPPKLPT